MKRVNALQLDPTKRSSDAEQFEKSLRRKIVGQDEALSKVSEMYQMFLAGLNAPGRPVGNLGAIAMHSNDFGEGSLVNVVMYGTSHTFLMTYSPTGGVMTTSSGAGILWETTS